MEKLFEQQDKAMEIIEKDDPALRDQLVSVMHNVLGVVTPTT